MSNDKPVTLRLDETDDTEQLAKSLIEQQRSTVGVAYAYCACGTAVSYKTAWRARKEGRSASCWRCRGRAVAAKAKAKRKSWPVQLCCICRAPLTGGRLLMARYNANHRLDSRVTCGDKACSAELRSDAQLGRGPRARKTRPACVVCGRESTSSSDLWSRQRGTPTYCRKHVTRGPTSKNRLPCAICGAEATRTSSSRARCSGRRAYCAKHPRGRSEP